MGADATATHIAHDMHEDIRHVFRQLTRDLGPYGAKLGGESEFLGY
ncbi:MAG: hypothetical protein ABSA39_18750 [Edaphobacter sp.]